MIFKRNIPTREHEKVAQGWFRNVPRPSNLTPEEKGVGRALLQEYMQIHPVRAPHSLLAARSPLSGIGAAIFSPRFHAPAMALGLIIVLTTGTAYAAEGTLPGNPLYGVKVHLTEEVREALAVGEKAKADWSIARAERRLEEASSLAVKGSLNEETRAAIQTNLSTHLASAEDKKQILAAKSDTVEANDVDVRVNALLNAHASVLGALQVALGSDEGGRTEVTTLLADVGDRITTNNSQNASGAKIAEVQPVVATLMMSARIEADTATAADVAEKTHVSIDIRTAEKQEVSAKNRIKSAERAFENTSRTLRNASRTELWTRAEAQLRSAREAYALGKTALSAKESDEASVHFLSALQIAANTEALLRARTHILDELLKITPKKSSEDRRPSESHTNSATPQQATSSPLLLPNSPATTSMRSSSSINEQMIVNVKVQHTNSKGDSISDEDPEVEDDSSEAIFHAIGSFGL